MRSPKWSNVRRRKFRMWLTKNLSYPRLINFDHFIFFAAMKYYGTWGLTVTGLLSCLGISPGLVCFICFTSAESPKSTCEILTYKSTIVVINSPNMAVLSLLTLSCEMKSLKYAYSSIMPLNLGSESTNCCSCSALSSLMFFKGF